MFVNFEKSANSDTGGWTVYTAGNFFGMIFRKWWLLQWRYASEPAWTRSSIGSRGLWACLDVIASRQAQKLGAEAQRPPWTRSRPSKLRGPLPTSVNARPTSVNGRPTSENARQTSVNQWMLGHPQWMPGHPQWMAGQPTSVNGRPTNLGEWPPNQP